MMKFRALTLMLVAFFGLLMLSAEGQAQATRTWVSGVGDDANPCSRTAPCKTFAGAISKTAIGGEINVLDPGGFGGVTITKSIQILSQFDAGVLVSGTNGITVNVGSADKVVLQGLNINGLGNSPSGITMIGGGNLHILNCNIRNFTQAGVTVAGAVNARVDIDQSTIINNNVGVQVQGTGGLVNRVFIQHTLIDNNTLASVTVDSTSAVFLADSTLTGSPASLTLTSGGSAVSYGNNVFKGTGVPTSTLPLQ